jgi:hypothetical protein
MDRTVEIKINGQTKKLKFTYNSIADVEEKIGLGIGALFAEEKVGFNTLRYLLWGGLKWQDKTITPQAAGAMIEDHLESGGRFDDLYTKIVEAMQKSKVFSGNSQAEAAE